ncbi:hypothetical protein ACQEU3_16085 [Spirillospora sp. CA-253888]
MRAMEAGHRDFLGHCGVVPLAGPTLLHVAGETRWYVDVRPVDSVRTFDREIEGQASDVVRYTGPTAQAGIRHAGDLRIRVLDARLRQAMEVFHRHDGGEVVVRLEQDSLLQLTTVHGAWSIDA